ncbi:MAG: hypothetical protein AAF790_06935 [Planctomycetota bacterium]
MQTPHTIFVLAQSASPADYSRLDADQWFALIVVIVGCATGAIISLAAIFAGVTTKLHRRASEVELKRDMLDRGMTAAEIAEVIEATPPTDFLDRYAQRHRKSVD